MGADCGGSNGNGGGCVVAPFHAVGGADKGMLCETMCRSPTEVERSLNVLGTSGRGVIGGGLGGGSVAAEPTELTLPLRLRATTEMTRLTSGCAIGATLSDNDDKECS